MYQLWKVIVLLSLFFMEVPAQFAEVSRLHQILSRYFAVPRSNTEQKQLPLTHINKTFASLGLQTALQIVTGNELEIGFNVIGVLPGRAFQSKSDRIIVIGANYDTAPASPGVADNGSGVTSMLELSRLLAMMNVICANKHTVIFAAFDFGKSGYHGSSQFVIRWLQPYLQRTGSVIGGVFILQSLLNFDPLPTSQAVPPMFEEVQCIDVYFMKLFSREFYDVDSHSYMGDYLQLYSHHNSFNRNDQLPSLLLRSFNKSMQLDRPWPVSKPWIQNLNFNLKTQPNQVLDYDRIKTNSRHPLHKFMPFLNGDHRHFWHSPPASDRSDRTATLRAASINEWPSVVLTDTGRYRGQLQYCHESYCDGLNMLTKPNLLFLALATDTTFRAVAELASSECAQDLWDCEVQYFDEACPMCALAMTKLYEGYCNLQTDERKYFAFKKKSYEI